VNPIQSSSSSVDLPSCPTQAAQVAHRGARSCASRITSPQAKASFYLSFYDGTQNHSVIILRYCDKNAQSYRPSAKPNKSCTQNVDRENKGCAQLPITDKKKRFLFGATTRVAER
jgi:hypothetical protein